MEEWVETMMDPLRGPKAPQLPSGVEMNKNLSTSSKYKGLTAAMAAELMIGFGLELEQF